MRHHNHCLMIASQNSCQARMAEHVNLHSQLSRTIQRCCYYLVGRTEEFQRQNLMHNSWTLISLWPTAFIMSCLTVLFAFIFSSNLLTTETKASLATFDSFSGLMHISSSIQHRNDSLLLHLYHSLLASLVAEVFDDD